MTGGITIKPNRFLVTTVLGPKKYYDLCFLKRDRNLNVREEVSIALTKKQLRELREEINCVLGDVS